MNIRPITENCRRNFLLRTHACFGISPFNSYFSEERIRAIASWSRAEFDSVHFFVPDVPSAYTLEALGYHPEKAAWKARRQCQYLHNKIHKALKNVGYSDQQACSMVLNWEKLAENSKYMKIHEEVKTLFENDLDFQNACIDASRWVLEKRAPDDQHLTPQMLRSAARYLLTEIPLFIDTAAIVGKPASVFCYHQKVEFLEQLYQGNYRLHVAPCQGFVVVEPTSTELVAWALSKSSDTSKSFPIISS